MSVLVVVLLTAFSVPGERPANGAVAPKADRTVLARDNVSYSFPFPLPSAADIVGALPQPPTNQSDLRITCELIAIHQDAAKFYPFAGRACIETMHFKCTVLSAGHREVVYIDHSRLVKVP